MSARPALPAQARETIAKTAERRRVLMKQIATLQDEKRQLPNNKTLAEKFGVGYDVVRRILSGDPYKIPHPDDDKGMAA